MRERKMPKRIWAGYDIQQGRDSIDYWQAKPARLHNETGLIEAEYIRSDIHEELRAKARELADWAIRAGNALDQRVPERGLDGSPYTQFVMKLVKALFPDEEQNPVRGNKNEGWENNELF